jgi:hypothetical protein
MTPELDKFVASLETSFFRYAHLSGAVELYMLVLETPALQHAANRHMSAPEKDWREIHRFMVVDGQSTEWYPPMPLSAILAQRFSLLGFLYGVTLSGIVSDLDLYLASALRAYFKKVVTSGSAWDTFTAITGIPLLDLPDGHAVYTLLQERHKIMHNHGRIDQLFIDRLSRSGVADTRSPGDSIQKSHLDVLHSVQLIRRFTALVDERLSELLSSRSGV